MNNKAYFEYSPLCRTILHEGNTIEVEICRGGEEGWLLEVIDRYGNSTFWEEPFETDQKALDELNQIIATEGIESLIVLPSSCRKNTNRPTDK